MASSRDGKRGAGIASCRKCAVLLLFGLSLALLFYYQWRESSKAVWHGEYFLDGRFVSTPNIRRDAEINFDWTKVPPFLASFPISSYAVRWTTCLKLESSSEINFELASDDGARLFLDRKKIIEDWGPHRFRQVRKSITLAPGRYPIVLEYYQLKGEAKVALDISCGKESAPRPCPGELFYPWGSWSRAEPLRCEP